jgi:hypothetical protein
VTDFEQWKTECENDPEILLICMEGKGETALYQTRSKHKERGEWKLFFKPIYHVWINGVCTIHTAEKNTAFTEWKKRPRKGR